MTKQRKLYLLVIGSAVLLMAATGNIRWTQLRSGDRHGTGTLGQASDGTGASGNCAKFAADGSVTDAGGACGVAGGAAGGDLSGTYPNPTVAKVNNLAVPPSAPCVGTNASSQFVSATCGGSSSNPVPTFTWDNQGASTATDSAGTEMLINGTTPSTIAVRYASAPATPYSISSQIISNYVGIATTVDRRFGMLFRESSTGKITSIHFGVNSGNSSFTSIDNWTTAAALSANVFVNSSPGWNPLTGIVTSGYNCFRIRDDGTNLSFWYSVDCTNYFQVSTNIARASFMLTGPNQVGWSVMSTSAGPIPINATMMNWIVTSP